MRDRADINREQRALTGEAVISLLRRLDGWEIVDERRLLKTYRFPDFVTALAFVNRIGEAAETLGHYPVLTLGRTRVSVEIGTRAADGMNDDDFTLAARIDELPH